VKFCMRVGLLSGQVFSPFGEHWLAVSHGGGGITSGWAISCCRKATAKHITFANTYHVWAPATTVGGHSELGAAALLKAVWWGMCLASMLTHLFFHSLSLLIKSSSFSAITTKSSAYNSSQGKATLNSLDMASMTITNNSWLNAEPWCMPSFTSKQLLLPRIDNRKKTC